MKHLTPAQCATVLGGAAAPAEGVFRGLNDQLHGRDLPNAMGERPPHNTGPIPPHRLPSPVLHWSDELPVSECPAPTPLATS